MVEQISCEEKEVPLKCYDNDTYMQSPVNSDDDLDLWHCATCNEQFSDVVSADTHTGLKL